MFNVLRGDMSLVGPRPAPLLRRNVFASASGVQPAPPGAAGHYRLVQINGYRGDSSIEKRLEYDLYYVSHRSLLFNLWILVLTPLVVVVEKNAC